MKLVRPLAFALVCASTSCERELGELPPPPAPVRKVPPSDAASFLARLSPLPSPTLAVTYTIAGPNGMSGDLEILLREGGFRRENWHLVLAAEDGPPLEVRGVRIHTPAAVWEAIEGQAGEVRDAPLEALAAAYLARDEDARRVVIEGLEGWQADLAAAREAAPGVIAEVAGYPCLETRVAGQELCLWERTGLPLRYRGSEFSLEATMVERDVKLSDDAFDLPPEAANARKVPGTVFDAKVEIDALADRRYGSLALLLTPLPAPPK